MKNKYRVFINGVNFIINFENEGDIKYNFYTTVFVEANNEISAENVAIELLKSDKELKEITLNKKNNPPILIVEEIDKLKKWPKKITRPRTGLCLYKEDCLEE